MAINSQTELDLNRYEYMKDCLSRYKEEAGDRVLENKRLLNEEVWLVDPHTHSTFSDGRGSVTQNYDVAMACGLDFVYITDHNTVEQAKYSTMIEGISWGQEPVIGREHIVLLNPENAFIPQTDNLAELYQEAMKKSMFVFLPHPGGQGIPITDVEERVEILKTVGPRFAMEVMNGIFRMFRSWDVCDELSVSMWDQLLRDGFQVTPIGSSDAHEPFGIGTAFTGVYSTALRQSKIAEALFAGNCFASEAPLLQFKCNDETMGGIIESFPGKKLNFELKAADICGLKSVEIISDGHVIKRYNLDNATLFEEPFTFFSGKKNSYFRMEVVSKDDRRAFASPIYTLQ